MPSLASTRLISALPSYHENEKFSSLSDFDREIAYTERTVASRGRGREEQVWRNIIRVGLSFLIAALLTPLAAQSEGTDIPDWAEVSAILTERCVMCHSEVAGASKGLRLDDYAAALLGSERGPVMVPGDVSGSELIRRLRGESTPRMPFLSRPLPDDQIALIESWIAAGMPNRNGAR